MEKHPLLTRLLAVAGTVLVWLVLLAPLVFGVAHWLRAGWFAVDYLMPAELSPVALLGGLLLVLDLIWHGSLRRNLGWVTAAGLVVIAILAVVFARPGDQAQLIFGGMLRLDIEPFVLGLPPKRSEE